MADGFSARYGDLLYGSYDCVDRIVLNAYHTLGYNPGGFSRPRPVVPARVAGWADRT
jgi:hypothetical protein